MNKKILLKLLPLALLCTSVLASLPIWNALRFVVVQEVFALKNFLIPLFSILATILFYPVLMIYVALIADAGVFTWLIFAGMLSPYIALWYYIVKKRMLNYFKFLLDNKPQEWNIEKTFAEYQEILKKQGNSSGDQSSPLVGQNIVSAVPAKANL